MCNKHMPPVSQRGPCRGFGLFYQKNGKREEEIVA